MASFIRAIALFGPRLVRQPTVRLEELAERIAELTGLRTSQVTSVLYELQSALLHYCKRGYGLELPGIGYFRPSLRHDGRVADAGEHDAGDGDDADPERDGRADDEQDRRRERRKFDRQPDRGPDFGRKTSHGGYLADSTP